MELSTNSNNTILSSPPPSSSSSSSRFVSDSQQEVSFKGHTVVLPTLSIGHVGQLAVDLLVASNRLPRVGFLEDENLLSLVGNDAYRLTASHSSPSGSLSTNFEVFQDENNKVTYCQQRAPVIKNHNHLFVRNLVSWLVQARFQQVVVLASVDSARRVSLQQFQLQPQPSAGFGHEEVQQPFLTRYLTTTPATATVTANLPSKEEGWWPFEEGTFDHCFKTTSFTSLLIKECHAAGLPVLLLAIFCGEGMTVPYGIKLAEGALSSLSSGQRATGEGQTQCNWSMPLSWTELLASEEATTALLYG
ncbi:Proteasome assembly chaperone 2 [Balamuthia mandrillaris]